MSKDLLRRECEVFSAYLLNQEPTDYVLLKYREGNAACGLDRPGSRIDRALLRAARTGVLGARTADSYARFFRGGGLLRKKLILLLAILENSAPAHRLIDGPEMSGRYRFCARMALQGAAFLFLLAAGTLLFLPLQLLSGPRRG